MVSPAIIDPALIQVKETLRFAVMLRLPEAKDEGVCEQRVCDVMTMLRLQDKADVIVGNEDIKVGVKLSPKTQVRHRET